MAVPKSVDKGFVVEIYCGDPSVGHLATKVHQIDAEKLVRHSGETLPVYYINVRRRGEPFDPDFHVKVVSGEEVECPICHRMYVPTAV